MTTQWAVRINDKNSVSYDAGLKARS